MMTRLGRHRDAQHRGSGQHTNSETTRHSRILQKTGTVKLRRLHTCRLLSVPHRNGRRSWGTREPF
jgi:hypothetical protein